jgi:cell division protein FtsL
MSAQVGAVRARVKSHPRLSILALVGLAVLVTGLGLRRVGHRREVVRLGYELSAATVELRRLDEEARRLRLEKSVLTSPARIEHLAQGLGMVRPAPEQIRIVWRAPAALAAAPGPEPGRDSGSGSPAEEP